MLVPCKDCADRHYLCHSKCEDYAAYKSERERVLSERAKEGEITGAARYGSKRMQTNRFKYRTEKGKYRK